MKLKLINFFNDKAKILENVINLEFTFSGHCTLPLIKKSLVIKDTLSTEDKVLVGLNIQDRSYKEKLKLHRNCIVTQVGHPSQAKLQKLLKQVGVNNDQFFSILESISFSCEICAKYTGFNPRPVVGFSLAKEFNDIVAMDLKPYKSVHFLHLIDLGTRYGNAVVIHSNGKEVIVKNIMLHLTAIFGAPVRFLLDNGGEFNNLDFQDMSENLKVEIAAKVAESLWSNGVVERHNAVTGNMLDKTFADTDFSLETALA